jgi:UDP-glucose 4-epimerase
MRAVVTGSAGFIGSHLVDSLLADSWNVIGIDDMSAGNKINLELANKNEHFTQVKANICSKTISKYFKDVDVVFHNAASKKNICLNDPQKDLKVNAGGTLNLLQLSVANGIKKFVHASTGSVYGEPVIFPQDEYHPLNPCSYYGVSKLAGERYVAMYNKIFGLNTTILRYFHVFGKRQDSSQDRGGVVSIFLKNMIEGKPVRVFGNGGQQRSFTNVSDVVRANRFVAENIQTDGEVYNVASGLKITINQLIALARITIPSSSEFVTEPRLVGDIDIFEVDNSKIKQLGFEFKTDFEKDICEVGLSLQPK